MIWNWRADWQYYQSLQNLCANSILVHRIVQYIFWINGWNYVYTNLEKRTCSFRNSAFLINDWFQFLLRQFKSCNSNKKGSLYNSAPLLYRFWNFVIPLHFSSCKICHMKEWNIIFFFNINAMLFSYHKLLYTSIWITFESKTQKWYINTWHTLERNICTKVRSTYIYFSILDIFYLSRLKHDENRDIELWHMNEIKKSLFKILLLW